MYISIRTYNTETFVESDTFYAHLTFMRNIKFGKDVDNIINMTLKEITFITFNQKLTYLNYPSIM